jgi:hypothetical protein
VQQEGHQPILPVVQVVQTLAQEVEVVLIAVVQEELVVKVL